MRDLFRIFIDFPACVWYSYQESKYQLSALGVGWASGENRESGVNPERYRHCERGGGRTWRKPVIGSVPEKAVRRLLRREVRITAKLGLFAGLCKYAGAAAFGAEIRLRQFGCCRSFLRFPVLFPAPPCRVQIARRGCNSA